MARIKKNQLSGKIGNLIYRQTRYGIAVAQAPVKPAQTPSSEKQMRIRTQLANLSANCRLYQQAAFVFPLRADAFFEDKQPQHTLFNLFVQMNSNRCPVYLTRQERSAGGCVVAPCQFSRGTLAPIVYSLGAYGLLESNLNLGDLAIGDGTTVAELSEALISHNADWREDDELCFLYATQCSEEFTGVPRAEMEGWCLKLDTTQRAVRTHLYYEVSSVGFTSIENENGGYCLGMSKPLVNGGAAWLHLRRKGNRAQASPQCLYVVNDLYEQYRSEEAFEAAAKSYK